MSLKVVLPFSLVVFGGAATATTGVYFYSRGSGTGKGPNGDQKGPATPPSKNGQEEKKDDLSGEAMKKEASDKLSDPSSTGKTNQSSTNDDENKRRSNGAEDEESLRVVGTNGNPQGPKPPEDNGSTGVQSPDPNQSKDPGTPNAPDKQKQLSDHQSETKVPSEGDSRTQKGEEEGKQDSVDPSADNDSGRNVVPGGESNAGPKPESSKSSNEKGDGEVSEGAGNTPTQPQKDSSERSGDDDTANPKGKGVDAPEQITDNTKGTQEQKSPENAESSLPAENTNLDAGGAQLKTSQEEIGTPGSKPEDSSSLTGQSAGESSGGAGSVPQQSQGSSAPAGAPERDETTGQSESHETEDKKNQNADGAVGAGGGTKGPSSDTTDLTPKDSDSREGSPAAGDSK